MVLATPCPGLSRDLSGFCSGLKRMERFNCAEVPGEVRRRCRGKDEEWIGREALFIDYQQVNELEVQSWGLEVRGWKLEVRSWRFGVGGRRLEVRG